MINVANCDQKKHHEHTNESAELFVYKSKCRVSGLHLVGTRL